MITRVRLLVDGKEDSGFDWSGIKKEVVAIIRRKVSIEPAIELLKSDSLELAIQFMQGMAQKYGYGYTCDPIGENKEELDELGW